MGKLTLTTGVQYPRQRLREGERQCHAAILTGTPWLVNAWLNHEGYLLFHPTIGLRLGIEIER